MTDFKKPRRQKAAAIDLSKLDRLPPHSIEAEQGVLGCILLAPTEALPLCLEKKTVAEHFYDLRHQTLFETFCAMERAGSPIDLITVQQRLKDGNLLDSSGGLAYLSSLMDAVPSAANLGYYLDIVREKARLRRLLQVCTQTLGRVHEWEGEADQLVDEVERDILKLGDEFAGGGTSATRLGDELPGVVEKIQGHRQGVKFKRGPFTGLNYLDNVLCGLGEGQMIVWSARPGCGKTSGAMQVAEHVATAEGVPVGVFSMEMLKSELAFRQVFASAKVSARKFTNGFMENTDAEKFTPALARLRRADIWLDDTPGLRFSQLAARARRMHARHGVRLFVMDYVQLMSGDGQSENRARELSEVSTGIKGLAKELRCPVIVLAQMNRDFEKDPKRKPQLSDLKDTGQFEQDADVVMFNYDVHLKDDDDPESPSMQWLKRPSLRASGIPQEWLGIDNSREREGIDHWRRHLRRINILVAKQRSGESGVDCEMVFVKEWTRFVDIGVGDQERKAEQAAATATQAEMPQ